MNTRDGTSGGSYIEKCAVIGVNTDKHNKYFTMTLSAPHVLFPYFFEALTGFVVDWFPKTSQELADTHPETETP